MPVEVAVVIVSYHSREDLAVCLPAVAATRGDVRLHTVVVDCAPSDGAARFVRDQFPHVHLVEPGENLGYAGGNNAGLAYVRAHFPTATYIAILNPDTRVEPAWLAAMAELMEQDGRVAAVQAKLLLLNKPDHIDSAGNQSHVAGFGFVSAYGRPDDGSHNVVRELAYPSGAAMLVRIDALSGEPLFDDDYFMYLEDAELGWRLRLAGHRILYQPAAVVHHRHDPRKTTKHLYHLERNRWRLLLTCYRWRTLIVLTPMLLMVECMVLAFALVHGSIGAKLRSYGSIWTRRVRDRRRVVQAARRVSDRELLSLHTPTFDATAIRAGWLRGTVNGLMKVIWTLTRPVVR